MAPCAGRGRVGRREPLLPHRPHPTLKRVPDVPRALSAALGVEFRTVVVTSIIVLVATGAILAFDRLTEVEPAYAVTLGVKVVLSLWMFALVRDRRRHARVLDALEERPPQPTTLCGERLWPPCRGTIHSSSSEC